MKVRLITIGKMKKGPHLDMAADYISRIKHYLTFEVVAVKDEKEVLKRLDPNDHLIVCDEKGLEMTSKGLAKYLKEAKVRSVKYLTFVVGPSDGLSEGLKARAAKVLSFSRFTIQHDLAALVLLEQIYRACTIIKGEPYHR